MIRRPPGSTLDRSSAASDVYKRQAQPSPLRQRKAHVDDDEPVDTHALREFDGQAVSYTHLRAHETVLDLVSRLLLKKKKKNHYIQKAPTLIYASFSPYLRYRPLTDMTSTLYDT